MIIHLTRNAERGGGVLMSVTLPNLKYSFIFPVPIPNPVPFPDPDFLVFHTPELGRAKSKTADREQIFTSHEKPSGSRRF